MNRIKLEAIVDAVAKALGVDTGTCSEARFEAAVAAAERALRPENLHPAAGAVRPRCVSCGDPIDVEFSDRCPDCAKLQASKASVRCCAEPCVRGGRCENCGTWLADLPE